MSNKKKENLPINPTDPIFDKASLELAEKRHKNIGQLFDKAVEILEVYLDDPNSDLSAKMFPAKLASDIYIANEKFKREDARISIEKKKLAIEEAKSGPLPIPSGNNTFIQNNFSGEVNIGEIKKKQDELLASFREKPEKPS